MENTYESPTIEKLAAALAKAQGAFTFAVKGSVADMGFKGGRRKYADLASVLDAIRKPLAENGLSFTHQLIRDSSGGLVMRTRLLHESGEWLASEFPIVGDTMGNKNPIQGLGSTLTYARRYTLSALVGIAQDDDDGESSSWGQQPAQQNRQQDSRQNFRQPEPPQAPDRPEPPQPQEPPEPVDVQQPAPDSQQSSSRARLDAMLSILRGKGLTQIDDIKQELSAFYQREISSMRTLTVADVDEYINANTREEQ